MNTPKTMPVDPVLEYNPLWIMLEFHSDPPKNVRRLKVSNDDGPEQTVTVIK